MEQLAYLEEQHDGGALGHVRLGVGEQHQREGAEGGHGHEEVLVEGVAAEEIAECAGDDVVAGDEVGDEEERELGVHVAGAAEGGMQRAGFLQRDDGEEDDEGNDDAGEEAFLLGAHGGSCFLPFARGFGVILDAQTVLAGRKCPPDTSVRCGTARRASPRTLALLLQIGKMLGSTV